MPGDPVHDPNIEAEITPNFEVPVTPQGEGGGLYDRQESLHLVNGISVTLIGCGGVGVWVALALALGGVRRIALYDGDTLSLHNLNRYPLPPTFVGELKSAALAQWISLLRRDGEFNPRGEFNPEHHGHNLGDWVVCATDSLASRKMAFAAASHYGSFYLEVGADGETWSLSPNPPEFSTELEDVAGYTVTPVHVGPCMMAGAAAAYYVLHNRRPLDSHSCKWDGQRVDFESMAEEDYPTVECQMCGWKEPKAHGLINMVKHVRGVHDSQLGLADAVALVRGWWAEGEEEVLPDQARPEIVFDPVGNPAFREVTNEP